MDYRFKYTDSLKDFCKEHKAYWILDVIGSYLPWLEKFPFIIFYFDVEGSKCRFYAREDSDRKELVEQFIEYTDLDVSIKLYFENGVLCFPSDRFGPLCKGTKNLKK